MDDVNEAARVSLMKIVGEQLSSVEFVQDYFQVRFDGPTLNVYNRSVVLGANGKQTTDGAAGFRDAICDLIGRIVADTQVVSGQALSIVFEDGSKFVVSLKTEDYRGPEALLYHGYDSEWWVL